MAPAWLLMSFTVDWPAEQRSLESADDDAVYRRTLYAHIVFGEVYDCAATVLRADQARAIAEEVTAAALRDRQSLADPVNLSDIFITYGVWLTPLLSIHEPHLVRHSQRTSSVVLEFHPWSALGRAILHQPLPLIESTVL